MTIFLLDLGVPGGTAAGIAAIGLFLIVGAIAYVIFRLLRKTVRMAIRIAIVAAVMVIAVAGSASLYWFGTGSSGKAKPSPTRQK